MASKPVLTPELIKAGVAKNVSEYTARLEALRALHTEKAYNPPMSPEALAKAAAEASRGSSGGPAMALYGPGNEGDVRDKRPDREAESMAKAGGGRRGKKQGGEESQDAQSDVRVQAGQVAFGQQARPQGQEPGAGDSHRAQAVWTEQVYEAETEEAAKALVPAGAKAVETRMVWRATALVRQT